MSSYQKFQQEFECYWMKKMLQNVSRKISLF